MARSLLVLARVLIGLVGAALFLLSLLMVLPVLVNLPDSWPGVVWALVFFVVGGAMLYMALFDWPPWKDRASNAF